MARHVDRDDLFQAKIPFQFGIDERCHETSAGRVDVDGAIDAFLDQEVIDGLDVFILSRVRGTQDGTDADGVLVDQADGLLGIDHVAVLGAEGVLLLDIKVAGGLFPAYLDGTVHDDVGPRPILALGLAPVLPSLLHGERSQHDGLGRSNSGRPHGVLGAFVGGGIEQSRNHVDAAVLDLG